MATLKFQRPEATQDTLPNETPRWQAVEQIARKVAAAYNFGEIRTPVFEVSELFHRAAGETTDIVRKETYDFTSRGGDQLTLRPEGTAGTVRAAIENGLLNDQGARAKLYYIGPNFRYENKQSFRYRIHHQFGAEAFGVAEPEQDVECILLQMEFYRSCGVRELALRVNSLGDRESKLRYRDMLRDFLLPKKAELSDDSQRRLDENPLRILDSKERRDIEACADVPSCLEALSPASRDHFERVTKLLQQAGCSFETDTKLVRGFDYYTGTLWEVTAAGLGAQSAIGGGGRYDTLVEQLGGRPTPGVGFGSGLERLLGALEKQGVTLPLPTQPLTYLVYMGDAGKSEVYKLAQELRSAGLRIELDLNAKRKVGDQFKLANRAAATRCIVLGENEIAAGVVQLKDLATGSQQTVARADLIRVLTSLV
jgi:histidyl-tRNA synthetase